MYVHRTTASDGHMNGRFIVIDQQNIGTKDRRLTMKTRIQSLEDMSRNPSTINENMFVK